MSNEELIRKLIQGSRQRAIQESVAAVLVLIAFACFLAQSEVGTARYYGCLIMLIGTGFIAGVVWSYALSTQLLRSHSATDASFWREAFHAQAKLLRLAPLWYCAPITVGGILFAAPGSAEELIPFFVVAAAFVAMFAGITWLNRRAAMQIDMAAAQLTGS